MSENELRKWVSLENCPTALQPFIQVNTCHVLRINQVGRLYTYGWWVHCGECTCRWTPTKGMICPSLQHPPLDMNLCLRGVLDLFPLLLRGAQRPHRCQLKYRVAVLGQHVLTVQGQTPTPLPQPVLLKQLTHQLRGPSSLWTMGLLHIQHWGPN